MGGKNESQNIISLLPYQCDHSGLLLANIYLDISHELIFSKSSIKYLLSVMAEMYYNLIRSNKPNRTTNLIR